MIHLMPVLVTYSPPPSPSASGHSREEDVVLESPWSTTEVPSRSDDVALAVERVWSHRRWGCQTFNLHHSTGWEASICPTYLRISSFLPVIRVLHTVSSGLFICLLSSFLSSVFLLVCLPIYLLVCHFVCLLVWTCFLPICLLVSLLVFLLICLLVCFRVF